MNILKRSSNSINLASFWENYQLKKYNFDPPYQRAGDVWNEEKKSFLIDTILKNFPMPPIFLHQHIEDTSGKTIYDVIDGKQRLTTIIDFINGKVSLPDDFNIDGFGDERLNGVKFDGLERPDFIDWKRNFWRYELTIEYVDTDQVEIINNIFDRLNRNGMPLKPQELRKAKYGKSVLYKIVEDLSKEPFWQPILNKLERNRLEDHEFISELLFVVLEKEIFGSDRVDIIDGLYEKYTAGDKESDLKLHELAYRKEFSEISDIIKGFDLDFAAYKIEGVSHVYSLWTFAWYLNSKKVDNDEIKTKLGEFYQKRLNKESDTNLEQYRNSMLAGTKAKSRRLNRVNSLLAYCGLEMIS